MNIIPNHVSKLNKYKILNELKNKSNNIIFPSLFYWTETKNITYKHLERNSNIYTMNEINIKKSVMKYKTENIYVFWNSDETPWL